MILPQTKSTNHEPIINVILTKLQPTGRGATPPRKQENGERHRHPLPLANPPANSSCSHPVSLSEYTILNPTDPTPTTLLPCQSLPTSPPTPSQQTHNPADAPALPGRSHSGALLSDAEASTAGVRGGGSARVIARRISVFHAAAPGMERQITRAPASPAPSAKARHRQLRRTSGSTARNKQERESRAS